MYDRRRLSLLIDLTYHSVFKASWFRIVATIRAPWLGGLDHMGRMIALSWLRIFSAVSLSVVTTQRLPHLSSAIYKKCILVAHNLACVQDLRISGLAKEKSVAGKIDLGLHQYLAYFDSEFPFNSKFKNYCFLIWIIQKKQRKTRI